MDEDIALVLVCFTFDDGRMKEEDNDEMKIEDGEGKEVWKLM